MKETQFLDALKWRYAAKKMSGKEIPAEKLDAILEAIRLTPSSFGFTPYSVVVVQDKEIQAKLLPHCYNQSQIVDASALLVFAPWKNIHADQVDVYMKEIAEARNIPVESLNDFANAIKGKINHSSNEDLHTWASKQAYIALGFGLAAAAVEKIDSTPMEGFNPDAVNEVLGFNEKGLHAACILALGYRDEEKDFLASAIKVRRKKEALFIEA
ncbi:MAG: NAD(P)H-dependent oxidoreductase [Bacteroidota bacterium]|jgi:nitroreductase